MEAQKLIKTQNQKTNELMMLIFGNKSAQIRIDIEKSKKITDDARAIGILKEKEFSDKELLMFLNQ